MAIEIDFSDDEEKLFAVEYTDKLQEYRVSILGGSNVSDILRMKTHHWDYEEEYRLISGDQFFPVSGRIAGLYFGLRVSPLIKNTLTKAMREKMPIFSTKLDNSRITVVSDKQLN